MIKVANNLQRMLEKQADNAIDGVSSVFDSVANTVPIASGLSGATSGGLLGAGIGSLIEYLSDKKEKNYLKALLMGGGIGAVGGGLLGGGAGYLASSKAKAIKNQIVDAAKDMEKDRAAQAPVPTTPPDAITEAKEEMDRFTPPLNVEFPVLRREYGILARPSSNFIPYWNTQIGEGPFKGLPIGGSEE